MFQRIKEKYNGSSEYLDKWKRLYKIYCESIRRRNNFFLGDKFYEKIKKALINEIPWIKQNKKKIGNLSYSRAILPAALVFVGVNRNNVLSIEKK